MRRVSIRSVMAFIVVAGIAMAALRVGSPAWAGAMSSILFFTMVCSLLGVALRRGLRRVYWMGFAALGWSYLLLTYAPWLDEKMGSYLLGPELFTDLAAILHPEPPASGGLPSVPIGPLGATATGGAFGGGAPAGGKINYVLVYMRIGAMTEALLWAFLGGWVARYFASGHSGEGDR